MNLPVDYPAEKLTVEQIAQVAALSAALNARYADQGHLLDLMAGLPAPEADGQESGDREEFWFRLFHASGTAMLLPANLKGLLLYALRGEAGLAGQWLGALQEMDQAQRKAAAEVIGEGLLAEADFRGDPPGQLGELWLRDVEATAWRVLYADRRADRGPADREAFRDMWRAV
ncbi:hypothetical protein BIV57_00220 [Mangrovactinospora gilvigrisea]|uniref:Uncharacterized protein n=1 Tax=Mangrovactinospora gilvigrisea TaxID=1428644 RepID=A0A1J7BLH5_9ACTN|nr:hypothetical protein BIV57_00220 [Mangrovactinospora gilvigrisea]